MGTGIAICVLDAALDVLLVELDNEARTWSATHRQITVRDR
jgi:hypothetical protein